SVAISLFDRARGAQGQARRVWIALDAAVSGCGIFATHFIAMLAYDPGISAGYDVDLSLASLVFAVFITWAGLGIAISGARRSFAAIGGAVVGLGVAAMHYTGMMALEVPARVEWAPGIVISSVIFGSVLGALALAVATRRGDGIGRAVIASVLLTLAIVSH